MRKTKQSLLTSAATKEMELMIVRQAIVTGRSSPLARELCAKHYGAFLESGKTPGKKVAA